MPISNSPLALVVALALAPAAALGRPQSPVEAARRRSPLAPLPASTPGLVVHAPFGADSCTPCHARDDANDPGQVATSLNGVCVGCHAELEPVLAAKHTHAATQDACTNCHNPHNATVPKLLLADPHALCAGCHTETVEAAEAARVPHAALAIGARCLNCHDPHGSAVEKLLHRKPAETCLACHDREGMKSADGRALTNMGAWLAANRDHHGPVRAGDCTACHAPHGGENFRLLTKQYPATFYAAFDEKNYALCVSCHNDAAFTTDRTTALTGFRDGSRNLHSVHVNVGGRGRTCRACHEVHASGQKHHIRESVPFGAVGWTLKLNYAKTPDGGSCSETCHVTRAYRRGPAMEATVRAKRPRAR